MRRVLASLHDPTIRTQTVDQIITLKYRYPLSSVLQWAVWSSFVCSFSSISDERRAVKERYDYWNKSATIAQAWTIAQMGVKLTATPVNTCIKTTSSHSLTYLPTHSRVLLLLTMETTPQHRPKTHLRDISLRAPYSPQQITNKVRKTDDRAKAMDGNLVSPTPHHHP